MSKRKFQVKKTDLGKKDQQIFKIYHAIDALKKVDPIITSTIQVETTEYPEAVVFNCTAEQSSSLILKLTLAGEPNVFYKTIQLNNGKTAFTLPYLLTRNCRNFTVQLIGKQNNLIYQKEFSAAS